MAIKRETHIFGNKRLFLSYCVYGKTLQSVLFLLKERITWKIILQQTRIMWINFKRVLDTGNSDRRFKFLILLD